MLLAAQSGASNFALALSSLLVPGKTPAAEPGAVPVADIPMANLPVTERQIVAEPGKELPEIALDLCGDEEAPEQHAETGDDAPAGEDLPFAWFAIPTAPTPAPDAAPVAAPVIAPAVTPKAIVAAQPVEIQLPEAAIPGEPVPAQPKPVAAVQPAAVPTQPAAAREAAPIAPDIVSKIAPLQPRPAECPVSIVSVAPQPADTADAPVTPTAVTPGTAVATPAAPASMVPVTAVPAPAVPAQAVALAGPASTTVVLPTAPLVSAPVLTVTAAAPQVAATSQTAPVAIQQPAAPAAAVAPQPAPYTDAPAPQPVRVAAPAPAEAPAPHAATAPAAQPRIEAPQSITVASLIAQASLQGTPLQPVAFTPLRRTISELDHPTVTSVAAPSAAILQQVAPTSNAQQAPLDMRRQEWMGKMVETIEAMREAAPVKETRIALVPDALGKVDITVRQDGDRVHVHFATETQAARQILTDAQPKLAELAEQRGIRLGQTSVDSQGSGGAQSGQRHNDAQRPQNPSAPASARAAKDPLTNTDERVA